MRTLTTTPEPVTPPSGRTPAGRHDGKDPIGAGQSPRPGGDAARGGHIPAERLTATREAPTKEKTRARSRPRNWLWPERYRPWRGRATNTDMALMGTFVGVLLLTFAIKPIKPFLLASHPVALEILTGDLIVIGAAAAFARIGEVPLWLVVTAGALGMAKFDWLTWWAGRQWGEGIIQMCTTRDRARRYADRAATLSPWIVRIAVVAAVLPGIPTPIVYAIAGMTGMRLVTFLILNLAGALLITSLVAGLGYGIGQGAVDMVLLIDRYALLVSLTLIGTTFLIPGLRRLRGRRGRRTRDGHQTGPDAEPVASRSVDTHR